MVPPWMGCRRLGIRGFGRPALETALAFLLESAKAGAGGAAQGLRMKALEKTPV